MKFLVVLSMLLLAANAGANDVNGLLSEDSLSLYFTVSSSHYDDAVIQALRLEKQSKGNDIVTALNILIVGGKYCNFAYKLWIGGGQSIVKNFFPIQFRQLFSGSNVKIINVKDNLAIKLGADVLADRTAYGVANNTKSEDISWKLVPLWERNRVFFKIQSVRHHEYLELGTAADDGEEHIVCSSDTADTHSHHWYLKPALLEGKVLFFIYNREYNQALKIKTSVDNTGNRLVYTNAKAVERSPELFGWSILPLN